MAKSAWHAAYCFTVYGGRGKSVCLRNVRQISNEHLSVHLSLSLSLSICVCVNDFPHFWIIEFAFKHQQKKIKQSRTWKNCAGWPTAAPLPSPQSTPAPTLAHNPINKPNAPPALPPLPAGMWQMHENVT